MIVQLYNYCRYWIDHRLHKYKIYFQNKRLYHGKLLFNHTNYIGPGSSFEGANSIGQFSVFIGDMGYGTYIGRFCEITAKVGRFTSIANEVASNPGIHPVTYPYVSTSPMFYSLQRVNGVTFAKEQCFNEFKQPVEIGNDCWIGQKVFLNPGIKIGDGAIVYAGAVVTKDVPPYAIVAGIPAKVIKYRYSENDINFLNNLRWWDKPCEWLIKNSHLLCDIEKLKKELKK